MLLALAAAGADKEAKKPAPAARVTITAELACLHCTFGEGDGWTLGDMPAHFAFWWRMAARGARHAAATHAAPDQSTSVRTFLGIGEHFDALNAESFSRWRARPVAERVSEMRAAHDDLVAALRDLPDEFLLCDDPSTDGMRRYLWQPAVNHPRQHRPHIESALKEGARA